MFTEYKTLSFSILMGNKDYILKKIKDVTKGTDWLILTDEIDFKKIYFPFPPQGITHDRKVLIWTPMLADVTVFFSNREDGWNTLIYNLANKYSITCIQVMISDESEQRKTVSFEYFKEESHRLVRAMIDEKWIFYQEGQVLWFEDESNYSKRKIADRINSFIIMDYLKKLGLDISSDEFWMSNDEGIYLIEKANIKAIE